MIKSCLRLPRRARRRWQLVPSAGGEAAGVADVFILVYFLGHTIGVPRGRRQVFCSIDCCRRSSRARRILNLSINITAGGGGKNHDHHFLGRFLSTRRKLARQHDDDIFDFAPMPPIIRAEDDHRAAASAWCRRPRVNNRRRFRQHAGLAEAARRPRLTPPATCLTRRGRHRRGDARMPSVSDNQPAPPWAKPSPARRE